MNMKPGNILYKCSLCGKITKNPHVPDGYTALMAIIGLTPRPDGWTIGFLPGLTDIHDCGDGHYGISTLIGFEEDSKLGEEMLQHINQLDKINISDTPMDKIRTNVIEAAKAFIDQLNSFNDFNHTEVKLRAIELQKAVGKLYAPERH